MIKFLFIIFVILLVVAAYPWWHSKLPFINSKPTVTELNFKDFTEKQTQKVTLKKSAAEIRLIKNNDNWKVGSYSASLKEVKAFFTDLQELKIATLVSKNPDNQADYEVSSQSGTLVTLDIITTNITFIVGKSGQEIDSFYVRRSDSNSVYIAYGGLNTKVSQSVNDWRDKTLVNLDKTKLRKINLTGKNNFEISEKDNKWRVAKDGKDVELDNTDKDQLFNLFSPLEAESFADTEESTEFKASSDKLKITFTLDSTEKPPELDLLLKDSNYLVMGTGNPEIYKISSYKLSPLMTTPDKIK